MKTYYNQEDFLKDSPIQDGIINCRGEDLTLYFDLYVPEVDIVNAWSIVAKGNINAGHIIAWSITAGHITAKGNINAGNIIVCEDIIAYENITAKGNINAGNINAGNITANGDINAEDIIAKDIRYYGVCSAYRSLKCKSIKGQRENSKHFCLDGKVEITGN